MRKNFERRAAKSQELMQKVLEISDRELWRCDPSTHVEGKTYLQVTKLLQGYIENEVDLNRDGTCWETCPHYQLTESYGCFKELYCARQPKCSGKLLFCTFFVSLMDTALILLRTFYHRNRIQICGFAQLLRWACGATSTSSTKMETFWEKRNIAR